MIEQSLRDAIWNLPAPNFSWRHGEGPATCHLHGDNRSGRTSECSFGMEFELLVKLRREFMAIQRFRMGWVGTDFPQSSASVLLGRFWRRMGFADVWGQTSLPGERGSALLSFPAIPRHEPWDGPACDGQEGQEPEWQGDKPVGT